MALSTKLAVRRGGAGAPDAADAADAALLLPAGTHALPARVLLSRPGSAGPRASGSGSRSGASRPASGAWSLGRLRDRSGDAPDREALRDLKVLRLRGVVDPKHPFKRVRYSDPLPRRFVIGTVVDRPADFYSARLPRRARGRTLAEELLHDLDLQKLTRRRYLQIQTAKQAGGKLAARAAQRRRNWRRRRF